MPSFATAMRYQIRIEPERCKGCRLCVEVCPHGVLRLSANFNRRALHYVEAAVPERCTGCRSCADICPDAAIELGVIRGEERPSAVSEDVCAGRGGAS